MLSRKLITIAALLLCMAATGCAVGASSSTPGGPAAEPPADAAGPGGAVPVQDHTSPAQSNIVNLATVQPGDQFVGLTVESIEPYGPIEPLSAANVRIVFTGEITVKGTYTYHDAGGLYPDQVAFQLADDSRRLVPVTASDDKPFFVFSNQGFAREQFGPPGSHGQATIVIRDYVLERFPSSTASNRAVLVEVRELQPAELPRPKG